MEELAGWAATVVAAANVVLVIVNIALVALNRRHVETAENAVAAALESVEESWRARIDAMAPRVIGYPVLGANVFMHAAHDASARTRLDDRVFNVAQEPGRIIEVELRGVLRNDGHSTAIVRLGGHLEPWLVDTRAHTTGDYHEKVVLPPGKDVTIHMRLERTLEEWVNAHKDDETFEATEDVPERPGTSVTHITIFDEFDEGITDVIRVVASARVMIPVPGDPGRWRLGDIDGADRPILRLYPAQRSYWRSRTSNRRERLPET